MRWMPDVVLVANAPTVVFVGTAAVVGADAVPVSPAAIHDE